MLLNYLHTPLIQISKHHANYKMRWWEGKRKQKRLFKSSPKRNFWMPRPVMIIKGDTYCEDFLHKSIRNFSRYWSLKIALLLRYQKAKFTNIWFIQISILIKQKFMFVSFLSFLWKYRHLKFHLTGMIGVVYDLIWAYMTIYDHI